ncbi:hypothetical protein T11_15739 [Trichinella zimbabwensis]|uniref:Uncharacterized protein n=1 Tax=Trichinella zimbabwensis TaxID=268475 RepID=A0A0V1HT92_9BILA|nr:hypothetical protein T11_15739 [Trichinella zimbabwensis]
MRTIESEDCSWSHFEQVRSSVLMQIFILIFYSDTTQIQVHALNYLTIPEIKNTVFSLFAVFFNCFIFSFSHITLRFFFVFYNVQAADTVVLLMSMTIYGKLCSLLCRHLPDQVSMKASPNGRRVVSLHCCRGDNLSWYEVIASRLIAESCILRGWCATPQAMPRAIFQNFRIFRNFSPRPADTVVFVMSMTFYGKLWSLLCRHLPDQVSMKASPNGRRVATPQAMPRAIFQNFRIFRNFSPRHTTQVQIQLHALNYLDIPEIKNTVTADTVVLVMSMTFYGKLWSLLCCHLPDQVSMKASPNGRRVSTLLPSARSSFYEGFSQRSQSLHCCHRDNLSWYEVYASRLIVESCILRGWCKLTSGNAPGIA